MGSRPINPLSQALFKLFFSFPLLKLLPPFPLGVKTFFSAPFLPRDFLDLRMSSSSD